MGEGRKRVERGERDTVAGESGGGRGQGLGEGEGGEVERADGVGRRREGREGGGEG